jgi:hypothetical protein
VPQGPQGAGFLIQMKSAHRRFHITPLWGFYSSSLT